MKGNEEINVVGESWFNWGETHELIRGETPLRGVEGIGRWVVEVPGRGGWVVGTF